MRLSIFFFLLTTVAAASAAIDPPATNFTSELEVLLAGEGMEFVNRSAGDEILNQTNTTARADPPLYHLMRNDTMFRDFENLTAPVSGIPLSANDSWNESFFEILMRDWW